MKTKMTSQQKQSSPYLAYIISVLSIALCFAVFLRTEFELMEHRKRIEALEDAVKTKASPTLEPTLSTITKHIAGEYLVANSARKSCDAKLSRHYFIIIWKRQN